jgi:hypothetical protein
MAPSAALTASDQVGRWAPDAPPFGVYVLAGSDPEAELARSVERDVFYEFFGNTPELLAEEYDRYEDASLFLCAVDHERDRAAGIMRIITPSAAGFKSLDDIGRAWGEPPHEVLRRSGVELERDALWDIATLAVAPEYRGDATGGMVSLALYQALGVLATARDVRWLVAILDLVVLDLIQDRTRRVFSRFDGLEPRNYLDSPASLPVYSDVLEYRSRVALLDRPLYELIFEGKGLEAVVSLPFASPVAASADGERTVVAG